MNQIRVVILDLKVQFIGFWTYVNLKVEIIVFLIVWTETFVTTEVAGALALDMPCFLQYPKLIIPLTLKMEEQLQTCNERIELAA